MSMVGYIWQLVNSTVQAPPGLCGCLSSQQPVPFQALLKSHGQPLTSWLTVVYKVLILRTTTELQKKRNLRMFSVLCGAISTSTSGAGGCTQSGFSVTVRASQARKTSPQQKATQKHICTTKSLWENLWFIHICKSLQAERSNMETCGDCWKDLQIVEPSKKIYVFGFTEVCKSEKSEIIWLHHGEGNQGQKLFNKSFSFSLFLLSILHLSPILLPMS